MAMELVQMFNAEVSSIYEVKPPISKAKMSQITKAAIKGIKMYKHIVQSVERFILKCRSEYKVPGLYVIDSIVRQSRHQFGADRDVFGPRFSRNFPQTFQNLFLTCPQEDRPKIVRVLNLWQRNNVFTAEIIQPLLDMANPNAQLSSMKLDSPLGGVLSGGGGSSGSQNDGNKSDNTNLVLHLQQLANTLGLMKSASNNVGHNGATQSGTSQGSEGAVDAQGVRFNKKLLDFDYGEDDEDDEAKGETPTEAEPPTSSQLNNDAANANPLALSMAQNLLSNPELLQRLQQMQKSFQQNELMKPDHHLTSESGNPMQDHSAVSSFISSFQPVGETKLNDGRYDGDLLKVNQFESNNSNNNANVNNSSNSNNNFRMSVDPVYPSYDIRPEEQLDKNVSYDDEHGDQRNQFASRLGQSYSNHHRREARDFSSFNDERGRTSKSRSPSPRKSYNRGFTRSGFRDVDDRERDKPRQSPKGRSERRSYRSRSKSPRSNRYDRQRMSPSFEAKEREKERERERKRKGLTPIKKDCLTICSTTLWLGHLPKLVSEADISDTFGEYGTINSIDLIAPRGCGYVCMNRRQDSYKGLNSLKNLKLHGSAIKIAWAPGKGMKGKEFKDYWDAELGVSYIPYDKIPDNVDLELLEEGGMIDEDTVPEKLKELRKRLAIEQEEKAAKEAAMLSSSASLISLPLVPPPPFGMPLAAGLVGVPSLTNVLTTSAPSALSAAVSAILTPTTSTQAALGVNSSGHTVHTNFLANSLGHNQLDSTSKSVVTLNSDLTGHGGSQGNINLTSTNMDLSESPVKSISGSSQQPVASASTTLPLPPPPPLLTTPPPAMFQPPPMNIPPPNILNGQRPPNILSSQRPPPPMPWLNAPPPPLSGQNAQRLGPPPPFRPHGGLMPTPHSPMFRSPNRGPSGMPRGPSFGPPPPNLVSQTRDSLPPHMYTDREFNQQPPPSRLHSDRGRDGYKGSGDDDPFAPSLYELRAMQRNRPNKSWRRPWHGVKQ